MDIRVGPEPSERAAEWIARRLRDAVRRRGSASLAVSGGSTAPPMIAALTTLDVAWDRIGVWQVDERVAPDGDDARNAGQLDALEALTKVRLMPVTAGDLRAAARRYAATLPERFDVVHLGVGDDGHTASWPPGSEDVGGSARSVELVDSFNGLARMTLTRSVVNGAWSRVVLASGAKKAPIIERWFLRDPELPITSVRRADTWVFLDDASAPPSIRLESRPVESGR